MGKFEEDVQKEERDVKEGIERKGNWEGKFCNFFDQISELNC